MGRRRLVINTSQIINQLVNLKHCLDDDHYRRVKHKKYTVVGLSDPYNKFLMLQHEKDKPNPDRLIKILD